MVFDLNPEYKSKICKALTLKSEHFRQITLRKGGLEFLHKSL